MQPRAAASERGLKAASDRLLLDVSDELTGPEVLVVLLHGTTLASALRAARPDLRFTFFTPEHFFSRTLHSFNADSDIPGAAQCRIICAADPPQDTWDSIVFPTFTTDSSEAAQELFQALQTRLRPGGRLFVSTNNPRDRWIQAQLRPLFSPVEVRKLPRGVLCVAVRSAPLKKLRGFYARFGFRCHDQVLLCETRPGVFSHRRLDGGARALIPLTGSRSGRDFRGLLRKSSQNRGDGIGQRRTVSVATASTFATAEVLAIDSDARAIECTQRSAALNQLTNIRTLLSSEGVGEEPGTWDLLLGNPPYYSDFRIAELFLQTARKLLRPGGRVHIVSKPVEWQLSRMQQLFADVQQHTFGEYFVFTAVRKAGKAPGKHGS
ncbi:MAG UNVERIFIED_CONTAM: class I SAM-dependent methyltransferase [Planctomycetaceae bacterium]|jgi:16S rRNA (guanine1207-N2)-methyltransferase